MARRLLSLALTVEQHDDGAFFWVILESPDRSAHFEPLLESAQGYPGYVAALNAGTEALQGISEDPDDGPREEVDETPGTCGRLPRTRRAQLACPRARR